MKRLDRLGKVENRLRKIWPFLLFGGTWVVVILADKFLLQDESRIVQLVVDVVLWGILFFVGLVIGTVMYHGFKGLRRLLGLQPLQEMESEIEDERREQEQKDADRHAEWIAEMPDSEYRIRTFVMQEQQIRRMRKLEDYIRYVLMGVIFFAVFLALFKYIDDVTR
jgi:hypothetical protein